MGRRKAKDTTGVTAAADDDGGVTISIPNDSLYTDLCSHNSYFDTLVDMIPAKLYISGNTGDEMYSTRYKKGQHKESKEARRARNKAARLKKFHPELAETTRQAKARLAREEDEEDMTDSSSDNDSDMSNDATGRAGRKRRMNKAVATDGKKKTKRAGAWADDGDDGNNMASTPDLSNEKTVDRTSATDDAPPAGSSSRIEALRAKLRAKIAEKQGLRPTGAAAHAHAHAAGGAMNATPDSVSKRAARRAEKQRRMEAAKKRADGRGGGGSTRVGKNDAPAKKFKPSDAAAALGGTVVNTGRDADNNSREADLAGC